LQQRAEDRRRVCGRLAAALEGGDDSAVCDDTDVGLLGWRELGILCLW
jgi:hypothetical protein